VCGFSVIETVASIDTCALPPALRRENTLRMRDQITQGQNETSELADSRGWRN
jgi:hypothetical protein